jgi:hypothetical protein
MRPPTKATSQERRPHPALAGVPLEAGSSEAWGCPGLAAEEDATPEVDEAALRCHRLLLPATASVEMHEVLAFFLVLFVRPLRRWFRSRR